jgi:hypothetical protein
MPMAAMHERVDPEHVLDACLSALPAARRKRRAGGSLMTRIDREVSPRMLCRVAPKVHWTISAVTSCTGAPLGSRRSLPGAFDQALERLSRETDVDPSESSIRRAYACRPRRVRREAPPASFV